MTAWGRETLLRAKEAAERRGARLLHALVDSLWLSLPRGADLERLRRAIERAAGCPLAVEGVYKWLRFCPSRRDREAGVPARYFGAFADGELKARGLACRRRDTPRLLKDLQAALLGRLARAPDLAGCRALRPELEGLAAEFRLRLRESRVSAEELAITFTLSKAPEDYVHDTLQALAAKKLGARGVRLRPGESVRYVIASAKDKVKDWRAAPLALMETLEFDAGKYEELLDRAAREILDGLW